MIIATGMRIDHIAIWVHDLEKMKDFYSKYFELSVSEKYINKKKGFSSYFLKFGIGVARIELMQRNDINKYPEHDRRYLGLAHFAIGLGSEKKVREMTERFRADGFSVIGEPRTTGDGYFESVVLDSEGNSLELTV